MANISNGVEHRVNRVENAAHYTTNKKNSHDGNINVTPAYHNDDGSDPEKHTRCVEHVRGPGTSEPHYNGVSRRLDLIRPCRPTS